MHVSIVQYFPFESHFSLFLGGFPNLLMNKVDRWLSFGNLIAPIDSLKTIMAPINKSPQFSSQLLPFVNYTV